jgi:L-ascorbate 6-phosphate lactonase
MSYDLLREIEDSPRTSEVRVWGLSGAGFVIRSGDDVVYIDPWLVPPDATRTTHRIYPPPFPPNAVKKADVVLSTHEHEDHCNVETLLGLNGAAGAKLVGPSSSAKKALAGGFPSSDIVTLHPGENYFVSPSFEVVAFEGRDPYEPEALMYLMKTPRGNILHSGDTSYFDGFKKVGAEYRVDLALLNFGKQIPTPEKPYYMDAGKLSQAARDLNAKVVVPMHWNLWVETREDPEPVAHVLRSVSPGSRFQIIQGGQRFEL